MQHESAESSVEGKSANSKRTTWGLFDCKYIRITPTRYLLLLLLIIGIYIAGVRPSHPFKVIEPEKAPASQNCPADGASTQTRSASNVMANDRRSISESISSERTTSSCDININYPRINSIGLLPVGDGSRSSGEMISDGTLASQILSMESFRNQQVSRQAHQDYSRLLLVRGGM